MSGSKREWRLVEGEKSWIDTGRSSLLAGWSSWPVPPSDRLAQIIEIATSTLFLVAWE